VREARRIGVGIGAGFRPRLQPGTAAKRKGLCSSERDHSEAGDGAKVFHVDRDDIEAQMQGCSADEQVREVDADALAHLLAVDASCQPRNLQRERMHRQGPIDFLDESLSAEAVGISLSPVDAMCQFDSGHSRERGSGLSARGLDALQNLRHAVLTPLACDQDAGVEDYSHAGGFHGLRLSMISLRSAANSGSMRGS